MSGRVDGSRLAADLWDLGLARGVTVFTHSSFRSIGPVTGGAATVVGAMEDSVGPEGLLLMPSFNLVEWKRRRLTWSLESTPSTVGWLSEFFRCMSGTFRSDHYSHSVAARGAGARAFVADHLSREGMDSPWDDDPWGKTYGLHSPMYRAYDSDGLLLMLGVDYESSTFCHLVEVKFWHDLRAGDPKAPYPALDRTRLGAYWDREAGGRLARGKVGEADCRLFRIGSYVDALLAEVERDPGAYLHGSDRG